MYLISRIPNMRSAGTPLPMERTTPLMKLESSIFPRLVQMTDGCYSVALQEPDGWATRIIRLADDETVWENRSESTRVPHPACF